MATQYFNLDAEVSDGVIYTINELLDQNNIAIIAGKVIPDLYKGIKEMRESVMTHYGLTHDSLSTLPTSLTFNYNELVEDDVLTYGADLQTNVNYMIDLLQWIYDNDWLNIIKARLNELEPDHHLGDIYTINDTQWTISVPTKSAFDFSTNKVIKADELNTLKSNLSKVFKISQYVFGILYDICQANSLTIPTFTTLEVTQHTLSTSNLVSQPTNVDPAISGTTFYSARNYNKTNTKIFVIEDTSGTTHQYGIWNYETQDWDYLSDPFPKQDYPTVSDSELTSVITGYNIIDANLSEYQFILHRNGKIWYCTLREVVLRNSSNKRYYLVYLKATILDLFTHELTTKISHSQLYLEEYYSNSSTWFNFMVYEHNFIAPRFIDTNNDDDDQYLLFNYLSGSDDLSFWNDKLYSGDNFSYHASRDITFISGIDGKYFRFHIYYDDDDDSEEGYYITLLGDNLYLSSIYYVSDRSVSYTINHVNQLLGMHSARMKANHSDDAAAAVKSTLGSVGVSRYNATDVYSNASEYAMMYSMPIYAVNAGNTSGSVAHYYAIVRGDKLSKVEVSSYLDSGKTLTYDLCFIDDYHIGYFRYGYNNHIGYKYIDTIDTSFTTKNYISFTYRLNDGWYYELTSNKSDHIYKTSDVVELGFVDWAPTHTTKNIYLITWS